MGCRRSDRRGWAQALAVAAGLLLIERVLVGLVGTPMAQLRVVRALGHAPDDPVTAVLAVLSFMAEALVGYVLLVLAVRSLGLLPGSVGRLASRAVCLLSPRVVRGLLDLVVGGALLAQTTLATAPGAPPNRGPSSIHLVAAASAASRGPIGSAAWRGLAPADVRVPRPQAMDPMAGSLAEGSPAGASAAAISPSAVGLPPIRGFMAGRTGPVRARPALRRPAAPLPPWLGGGPSKAASSYTVEAGDTLWDIAAAHLGPAERSSSRVHRYWQRIYRANRSVIGADPDLIHPGTRLDVPRFRGERP